MKGAVIKVGIPPDDAAEFAGLPEAVKWEVLDLLDAIRRATGEANTRAALAQIAREKGGRRGWSAKSLERKYYALRDTRDWRVLVDRAKAGGGGKSRFLTEAVAEAWKGFCQRHYRSMRTAWLHMVAEYRRGAPIGDVDWRAVWEGTPELRCQPMPNRCPPEMALPEGWSYYNLMRHKPREIETAGARRGRHTAKKLSAQVLTTRAGLRPGEQYEFDDMWHNALVYRLGTPKPFRGLELACIDIASAHKVAYGLHPRTEGADGKRSNLSERQMRLLVYHVLANIGYHRDGCTLLVEGQTATIRKRLQDALWELSGHKVKVSVSGVDRQVPLGKWGHDTRGNPDHKAHIESWHNLAQNRLDMLPGYTGSNARLDKPEDHAALEKVVAKMLAAACAMPPHLAERLRFPVLDWDTFCEVVAEVYEQIGASGDHDLEGWEGRTERQWRAHPAVDLWFSEREYLALPEAARAALAPLIARPGMSRVAKLSRRQVWDMGKDDLVRLPDYTITDICGSDLAEPRRCPVEAEIVFRDGDICRTDMVYRLASCVNQHGERVRLEERKLYLWTVNPFAPESVFVADTFGRYVGRCARVDRIDRRDIETIGEAVGHARKELDDALLPLQRRGKNAALKMADDMAHNARTLAEAAGGRLAGESRPRPEGIGLEDLTAGGGNDDDGDDGTTGRLSDLQ